jgi:hypothetical protein
MGLGNSDGTATSVNETIGNALFPNVNNGGNRLPAFGGESYGFAKGVSEQYAKSFYSNKGAPDGLGVPKNFGGELPRSIFNQYALFNYSGMYGSAGKDNSAGYRDNDQASKQFLGRGTGAQHPTPAKIIEFYGTYYPHINYKAQDFLYAKYYRKIPLNHLITLRRFPMPCEDNIFNYAVAVNTGGGGKSPLNVTAGDPKAIDATQVAGVTAVTYMGETAGNKLSEIMSMTFGLNWKKLESKMEAIEKGGGYTSQISKEFGSTTAGSILGATMDAGKGVSSGDKFRRSNSSTADRLGTQYADFVIGPVNVIDETMIRDRGLKFEQDLSLDFEYQLKSLHYVNPKVAMIDLISNMLTMTTNNATFWGGGQRYYGAAGYVASQYGDGNLLAQGKFADYSKSIVKDVTSGLTNIFGGADGNFDAKSLLKGGLDIGKTFLGNKLGGLLSSIAGDTGSTAAQRTFLSGEPTGNWHVTIGNPMNPIAMLGNMYCDSAVMTLGDGLGYDDFPMEVKFKLSMKHGKPRDKGDIENMFNIGQGRIYTSARNEADILNLAGIDAQTYGNVKAGTNSFQATQSEATGSQEGTVPTGRSTEDQPAVSTGKEKFDVGKSDEYIGNLVSLMIDS